MIAVKLPFTIDIEDAAYKVSQFFAVKGYTTDVKKVHNTYTSILYKKQLIHNIIGTPVIISVTFFSLDDGTGLQVKETTHEPNLENVVKEVALYALIFPGIAKRFEAADLEKKVMRQSLIIAKQLKGEKY